MKRVLILGDSHAGVFKYANTIPDEDFVFDGLIIGGATAQGAINPNGKSNALNIFKDALNKKATNFDYIMIMLGEVDCGFVIWYYSEKFNVSIDDQLNRSINNLTEFIRLYVLPKFNSNQIILLGAVLPTILDNCDKMFLKGARSDICANLEQRINLTFRYNGMLREVSKKLGVKYCDISKAIYDDKTKKVKSVYLNENPHDHHLSNAASWPEWRISLNNLLNEARE